jgi:hypothetical protein
LTSLRALQPDARALVIVLEAEAMLVEGHQVVFEGCFENTNAGYMVTRHSDDIGHRLWPTQSLRRRTESQLHCQSTLSHSRGFAYVNHLVVEIGPIC